MSDGMSLQTGSFSIPFIYRITGTLLPSKLLRSSTLLDVPFWYLSLSPLEANTQRGFVTVCHPCCTDTPLQFGLKPAVIRFKTNRLEFVNILHPPTGAAEEVGCQWWTIWLCLLVDLSYISSDGTWA